MEGLHPWWTAFGVEIGPEQLTPEPARALASFLAQGRAAGARLISLRQDDEYAAVHFETDVERPQDLAHAIRGTEPVAIFFPFKGAQPRVFALRPDFPDIEHQNLGPPDSPRSLCIDDRPWAEARLTSTSFDLIRRTQLWLAKAARGELHDPSQPLEPLFFSTSAAMIIPPDALTDNGGKPAELIGIMRPDNKSVILTYRADRVLPEARNMPGFIVLTFQAKPQSTASRMRIAPRTLGELDEELKRGGVEIMPVIRERLKDWAGLTADKLRRLDCRLAIVVGFPTRSADGREGHDTRAFICVAPSGELGVGLGILAKNVDGKKGYFRLLAPQDGVAGMASDVEMAQVHLAFTRELAAAVAGGKPDRRKLVLVGAGAIGSQVAVNLAREGKFGWTVVDQDYLLPHNLARHALFPADVAAPKAPALAQQLADLLAERCEPIICDVLNASDEAKQTLDTALGAAEIILDASASVAVSRHLSDIDAPGRRVCIFFNPAGTDAVLLIEDKSRSLKLRDLEAQYHRLVQSNGGLDGHLTTSGQGLRYSGSCRTLTNRIPATRAALLSAAVARGIARALENDDAGVFVWRSNENTEIRFFSLKGRSVQTAPIAGWSVTYDDGLLEQMIALRNARLPSETGGVLLGIVDMTRKSIHVAHALLQPEDSQGSVSQFERGVVGLPAAIDSAVRQSMHQLRYVGEWHSHPRRHSMLPSGTDLSQLAWLGRELEIEGLPGLMAIAADRGFAFVAADFAQTSDTGGQR